MSAISLFRQFRPHALAALLALAALALSPPAALALSCPPGAAPIGNCSPGQPNCCHPCAAQHYSNDGKSCKPCPNGFYASGPGSASCTGCPLGSVVNAAKNGCFTCADGLMINKDHASCSPCSGGKIPSPSKTACVPCPAGQHYQYGGCAPNPQGVRSTLTPGLLEGTPALGTQGPAATGRPSGGGAPSRGPAGVR